jgi:hypothetical protein
MPMKPKVLSRAPDRQGSNETELLAARLAADKAWWDKFRRDMAELEHRLLKDDE